MANYVTAAVDAFNAVVDVGRLMAVRMETGQRTKYIELWGRLEVLIHSALKEVNTIHSLSPSTLADMSKESTLDELKSVAHTAKMFAREVERGGLRAKSALKWLGEKALFVAECLDHYRSLRHSLSEAHVDLGFDGFIGLDLPQSEAPKHDPLHLMDGDLMAQGRALGQDLRAFAEIAKFEGLDWERPDSNAAGATAERSDAATATA